MALQERLLHRRELRRGVGKPFDSGDLVAVDGDSEQQARAHRLAVEQHGARPAHAVLAADVRAGQAEVVAQAVGQQPPRGHVDGVCGRR